MLFWIIVILALVVLAALAMAASKPNEFSVVREATMAAPAAKVHGLLNDFHEWARWSPWEKLDPNLQRNYSGKTSGVGAVYDWSGNKKVGQGRMEITGSQPDRINIDLRFMQPWQAHNQTIFNLTPSGSNTHVRWEMQGKSPFMFKLMGLFMNMDNMIGKDFEKGLAQMKAEAERP